MPVIALIQYSLIKYYTALCISYGSGVRVSASYSTYSVSNLFSIIPAHGSVRGSGVRVSSPFLLPFPSASISPSLLHLQWPTLFCCVGCILRTVETSRISVVRDIADRFGGWQQLTDIPSLTAIPFASGS